MANGLVGPFDWTCGEKELQRLRKDLGQILERAYLSNDLYVKEFEQQFAKSLGHSVATAASNGTAALEMALKASGVAGGQVIIPANTFIATWNAVINAGARPLIVDIEKDWFGLDLNEVAEHLAKEQDVRAVCHVHIGSHVSAQIEKLAKLCGQHNVDLIEDACQVYGAKVGERFAGQFGRFGCFSLFTTKVMTTGEGGMVLSSEEDASLLKSLRQFGVSTNDSLMHENWGGNYKLNEFAAAFGLMELERVQERIVARRERAQLYQSLLADSSYWLRSDEGENIGSYYKQVICSDRVSREQVQKHLLGHGYQLTGGVYYQPLHRQPIVQKMTPTKEFSNADWFADHHFCPPCYPEVTLKQVEDIANRLLELETGA